MVRSASSPPISAARLWNIQGRLNSNREDWKRSIYESYWSKCIISHGKGTWGWIESSNRWNSQTYHHQNNVQRQKACIMGIPVNLRSRAVCGAKMSLDFPSVLIQVCKNWNLALRLPKLGWNRTYRYLDESTRYELRQGLGYGTLQIRVLVPNINLPEVLNICKSSSDGNEVLMTVWLLYTVKASSEDLEKSHCKRDVRLLIQMKFETCEMVIDWWAEVWWMFLLRGRGTMSKIRCTDYS